MVKSKVYAVLRGRNPGVYSTWTECEKQVKGFPNAAFKSFPTVVEALEWIGNGGIDETGILRKKDKNYQGDENAERYFQEDHLDTNELPSVMPKAYAFVDG